MHWTNFRNWCRWRSADGSPTSSRSIGGRRMAPDRSQYRLTLGIQSKRCRQLSFPVRSFLQTWPKKKWQGSSSTMTVARTGLTWISCQCFTCQWSRKTVLARGSCFVWFTAGSFGRPQCRLFCRESSCYVLGHRSILHVAEQRHGGPAKLVGACHAKAHV